MHSVPSLRLPLLSRILSTAAFAGLILVLGSRPAFAGAVAYTALDIEGPSVSVPLLSVSSLPIDLARSYTASGVLEDGTTVDLTALVTWSSSDPAVATVSNDAGTQGLTIGVATGTTELRAEYGGITGVLTITVPDVGLLSINLAPANPVTLRGAIRNFNAAGTFSDGSAYNLTQIVSWTSSDPTIATVTNRPAGGRATTFVVGDTEISAHSGTIVGATLLRVRDADATCDRGPLPACKTAERATFTFADRADDERDVLEFAWTRGEETQTADFGSNYRLCVWDHVGGVPRLAMSMAAPGGGDCRGRACWKPLRQHGYAYGVRYVNRSRLPDGLERVTIVTGPTGKALVRVRGRGTLLPDPSMPFTADPKITVQLVTPKETCWGAEFSTSGEGKIAGKLATKDMR